MNYVNAVVEDKAAFERELDTPLPVFAVFVCEGCGACEEALPRFVKMADAHQGQVKVLILDCANTPRHPNVKRVPTLLIYQNGNLMTTFEGISDLTLLQAFAKYA